MIPMRGPSERMERARSRNKSDNHSERSGVPHRRRWTGQWPFPLRLLSAVGGSIFCLSFPHNRPRKPKFFHRLDCGLISDMLGRPLRMLRKPIAAASGPDEGLARRGPTRYAKGRPLR